MKVEKLLVKVNIYSDSKYSNGINHFKFWHKLEDKRVLKITIAIIFC